MLVRLGVALLTVFALTPDVCAASRVMLADESPVDYGRGWESIEYLASPGEVNRLLLTSIDSMTVRVSDPGAVITVGRGCAAIDAHTAECTVAGSGANGLIGAKVEAGDMNDVVESRGPGLSANGGTGDDLLESSSIAAGILNGGGGRDTLLGGMNRDTLIDGDVTGAVDSDVLAGRDNGAIVSYAARTAPVRVDLNDAGGAGEAGEGDQLRSITGVVGGRGADLLRGDGATNVLDGGPGPDRLYGLARGDLLDGGAGDDRVAGLTGDDILRGSAGRDVIQGGSGQDVLDGGDGQDELHGGAGADFLTSGAASCGSGLDSARPVARDLLSRDCETARFTLRVRRGEFADSKDISVVPYPVAVSRTAVTFEVGCPYLSIDGEERTITMRGRVRLRSRGGTLLGSARVPPRCRDEEFGARPAPLRIRVPLTSTGQRLLRSRARVITVSFAGRNTPPIPWRIRVRALP